MSDTQTLERAYRRILSCYPRSFRADSGARRHAS